MSQEVHDNIAR